MTQSTSYISGIEQQHCIMKLFLVDGVTELPRQAASPNSPVEVAIDIGHDAVSCEHTETVRLTATAVAAMRGVTETPTHSTSVDYVTAATSGVPPHITETTSQETPTHSTPVDYVTAETLNVPPHITDTTSQAIPAGYEVVNGLGYYKMNTNAFIWEQAREKCVQEGAHLIIINSDREAEVAKTLLKRNESKIQGATHTGWVWVGFHDSVTEGEYTTVLGEPLASSGYTRWWSGAWHNHTECNYGVMDMDGDLGVLPGYWKYPFICELIAQ